MLKEEYFENQRYQTREITSQKSAKSKNRKPAHLEVSPPKEEVLHPPVEQAQDGLPKIQEPAFGKPPSGWTGFLLGGDQGQIRDFRKSLDDKDIRKNWLEISFAPRWINVQSSSPYSPRSVQTALMGYVAEGRVWISPIFGVALEYGGTLSGSVPANTATSESSPLKQNWLSGGFRIRRFFGSQKKISVLSWGADYRERQQIIELSAAEKMGFKSRALSIAVESRIPLNSRWGLNVQMWLTPWIDHQESGGRVGDSSGTNVTSTGYGFGLGLEYVFDRGNRVFLRMKGDFESNQFQGSSALVDPQTAQVVRGAAVSQSYTLLELGYTWAD